MKALVTGITGQAGRYLAELLLEKGYQLFGFVRRSSNINTQRIEHLLDRIELISGDLMDEHSIVAALEKCQPDEVYNLAAQSYVATSWDQPLLTSEITGLGVLRILSAIKTVNPGIKFLQASSSEQFGLVQEIPQTEKTPFYPRSPYAVAKCFAHQMTVNWRESYGMFASCAIMFNNESPHRGLEFVTRKITDGINKIRQGKIKKLKLGNIKAKRDWGYTGDTVRAMHMIMQHTEPDDFVVSTGETHSVEEFLEIAFQYVGLNWQDYVEIDPTLIRPAEVPLLLGDSSKIRNVLGWEPQMKFNDLVKMMVEAEIK